MFHREVWPSFVLQFIQRDFIQPGRVHMGMQFFQRKKTNNVYVILEKAMDLVYFLLPGGMNSVSSDVSLQSPIPFTATLSGKCLGNVRPPILWLQFFIHAFPRFFSSGKSL